MEENKLPGERKWNENFQYQTMEDFQMDGIGIQKGDRILMERKPTWWERILIFMKLKKKPVHGIYKVTEVGSYNKPFKLERQ